MVLMDRKTKLTLGWSPFKAGDFDLLKTGLLADAEVKCGNRTWKVHKAIICTRSKWFKKALLGPFEEGQIGKVTITAFEENEVDCLLHYLYTGNVDLEMVYPGVKILLAILKVWKLADFFCLGMLDGLLSRALSSNTISISRFLCSVDTQEYVVDCVIKDEIFPAIKVVYQDDLAAVREKIMEYMLGLVFATMHHLQRREDFGDLLRDVPAFAADWTIGFLGGMTMPLEVPDFKHGSHKCAVCSSALYKGNAIMDGFTWLKYRKTRYLCSDPACFEEPTATAW